MALTWMPVVDSDTLAAEHRRDLDIGREHARALGRSAVEAAAEGRYTLPGGRVVDWAEAVRRAVESKVSVPPHVVLAPAPERRFEQTLVGVANVTTLAAAWTLTKAGERPLALNLASGTAPGGGFLTGSRAQEEFICQRSALHATLVDDAMYQVHRARHYHEASDWMIVSPDVPVFRDDAAEPLPEPWTCAFLTGAAPYRPRVGARRSAALLKVRIHRALAVAHAYGYESLVLGAWGCGAFQNDPVQTARDFREALEGDFAGCFQKVVFAITDWSEDRRFLGPFRNAFSDHPPAPRRSFVGWLSSMVG